MIEYPTVVPIAVVTAIILFFSREVLEATRRRSANSRKLQAIRKFIAAECERNNFSIERLQVQIGEVDQAIEYGAKVEIERRMRGIPILVIRYDDNGFGSSPIRQIHTANLEKYLFEVATLDASLFRHMEEALVRLTEVSHVRDSLVEYVEEDQNHLTGFSRYALEEIDEALDPLRSLYFNCTNEPLDKVRVR